MSASSRSASRFLIANGVFFCLWNLFNVISYSMGGRSKVAGEIEHPSFCAPNPTIAVQQQPKQSEAAKLRKSTYRDVNSISDDAADSGVAGDSNRPATGEQPEPTNSTVSTSNQVNVISTRPNSNIDGIHPNDSSTAFRRYEKVVIATKIHEAKATEIGMLEQSLCLLHHAYNHKVLYDIVVFSTLPVPQENIDSLQKLVEPAKITFVVDNRGLQEEIAALAPDIRDEFLHRCNVTSPDELHWYTYCDGHRLNYNWQAQFRGLHLWNHPALEPYKTMMWLDADAFSTKPWPKDPIEHFIENDGVVLFDHFPQGHSNMGAQKKLIEGFNVTLCRLKVHEEKGHLEPTFGHTKQCLKTGIPNIHGFFHITNLDWYRSEPVMRGLKALFSGGFLRRSPDDQLAVTATAAILAPERSWEMRSQGFHLDVFHNYMLDGIDQAKPAGFLQYWKENGSRTLPTAMVCPIKSGG